MRLLLPKFHMWGLGFLFFRIKTWSNVDGIGVVFGGFEILWFQAGLAEQALELFSWR